MPKNQSPSDGTGNAANLEEQAVIVIRIHKIRESGKLFYTIVKEAVRIYCSSPFENRDDLREDLSVKVLEKQL